MKKLKWKYFSKHKGYEASEKGYADFPINIWVTQYKIPTFLLSMRGVTVEFKKLSTAKKVAQIIHNG